MMPHTIRLKVGTRSSRLALIQTHAALERLAASLPICSFTVVPVSSPGDRDQTVDLRQSPADFFTRDLDRLVLSGDLDCAVHSAKDVPDPVTEGLDWFWLPWREDPRDVLVRPYGQSLETLPAEARIGVSSDRREAYCRSRFPAARQCSVRGTIEERLRQLDRGDFDLLVMAGAALNRLGLSARISEWIPVDALPPPEGQGVLALTFRAGDARLLQVRRLFVKSVTFAAGGAGMAGSLTRDGLRALRRCEVCLHDALLDRGLFDLLPGTVRCVDVGKRCGGHRVPQEETTALIARAARRGWRVVRLKGGDPGLFGRLAEEVEALDALQLPYRVLPGVSSLNAATSGTGLLLTRRGVSRGFTVLTPRQEGGGIGSVGAEERRALPLVFFMALAVADAVVRQLTAEGMPSDTPAAVVYAAGSDQSHIVSGTLGDIVARITAAATEQPGLLIVGEAAAYRYHAWGALAGRRVLLTASEALQERAADQVTDLGGVPVCRPLIRLETASEARDYISRVGGYDWVVLTSPSAVRCFGDLLRDAETDLRTVPTLVTCGKGTAQELRTLGLHADVSPAADYSAEGLLETVRPLLRPGLRILRLRSDKAGIGLGAALRALGACVDDVTLYRNRPLPQAEKPEFDAALFASASAVDAYDAQWGAASLAGVCVVAMGRPTVDALKRCGVTADVVSDEATVEASLACLARHCVCQGGET